LRRAYHLPPCQTTNPRALYPMREILTMDAAVA
jgi:hypothetical protein